jgi:hypothetical protein
MLPTVQTTELVALHYRIGIADDDNRSLGGEIMNTIAVADSTRTASRRRAWKWIALGVGALALVFAVSFGIMLYRMSGIPADLDLTTTRLSNQGLYRVSYTPNRPQIAFNEVHNWNLHVTTPDGQPITDATITVDGGMPQHGHGLPSQPQVTKYLGDGDYLVEGMNFQMGGWWTVDFTIDAGQHDTVRFNMILK